MNKIIKEIEKYEDKALLQNGIDRLCTNYNSLAPVRYVWSELYFALPKSLHYLLEIHKSGDPYYLVNHLIMKYGRGERVVKYYFAKQFLEEKNLVCLFEYNVIGSRLDFGRINGHTYAYEIKTENDNLDKLGTQLKNYEKMFDYLYIIVHEKHIKQAKRLVNNKVGIITYNLNSYDTNFVTIREAKKNKSKQKKELIKELCGADLSLILNRLNQKVPKENEAKRNLVAKIASKEVLFRLYKDILRDKYQPRWDYIVENHESILPIDFQTIFAAGNKISIFRNAPKLQQDSEA